jgi:predicted ABC-type ATPase
MSSPLDQRPILVALAGPNGAGKTTFYHSHLKAAGLRLVNADVVARELNIEAYQAARLTAAISDELVNQRESFVFETVFSDPVGDKISFFQGALRRGYTIVLCFVGILSPEISDERVAMRVSQGGHDVPFEKLHSRFPRILKNLKTALAELPHVRVFDNDDLGAPYRLVAICEKGQVKELHPPIPKWLGPLLPKSI